MLDYVVRIGVGEGGIQATERLLGHKVGREACIVKALQR